MTVHPTRVCPDCGGLKSRLAAHCMECSPRHRKPGGVHCSVCRARISYGSVTGLCQTCLSAAKRASKCRYFCADCGTELSGQSKRCRPCHAALPPAPKKDAPRYPCAGDCGATVTLPGRRCRACYSAWATLPVPTDWAGLVDRWLVTYQAKEASEGTIALRRSTLRRFADGVGKPPAEVTEDDVTQWVHGTHGWGAATKTAQLAGLRGFFGWAHAKGHLPANPTTDVIRPRPPQPRPRPVPDDMYQEALAKAVAMGPEWECVIELAGRLGLRRAEVAGLHRQHLLTVGDGLYALRFVGKGDKERTIPCPTDLAEKLLASIDAESGYLLPSSDGGHLTPHWVGTIVSRDLLRDGYTMHKLRHKAGTDLYSKSGDIYLASQLLGHSNVATTAVYVRHDLDKLRELVS